MKHSDPASLSAVRGRTCPMQKEPPHALATPPTNGGAQMLNDWTKRSPLWPPGLRLAPLQAWQKQHS